ncbi:MAG: hypothetical protein IKE46_11825 [Selenomonadaceae bacterium]|nr:hypothetical protein [Selenomonadaceae bacterium]
MNNGQHLARARHLEDVANGAKRYILAEILDMTNAVTTELENISGGANYDDFTGATSITGGASGLVPAPSIGDEDKFLRGDGTWATVSSDEYSLPTANATQKGGVIIGGGLSMVGDTLNVTISGGVSYADFTGATSIAGGLSGLVPAPAIGEENKFLRGDGTWASVARGGGLSSIVLSTVTSHAEGGLWYQIINTEPILKLRCGEYVYSFNPDGKTIDASANMICHLPFDNSITENTCGDDWIAGGIHPPDIYETPYAINGKAFMFNASGRVQSPTPITFGGRDFTIDFHAYVESSSPLWSGLFCARAVVDSSQKRSGVIWLVHNSNSGVMNVDIYDSNATRLVQSSISDVYDARRHFEIDYLHDNSTLKIFVDGQEKATYSVSIERLARDIWLGANIENGYVVGGYMDEFRMFDGIALHDSDFTPPTAADYF